MPNALITGASTGLGRAVASALAYDGWTLTIDGRRQDRLQQVAAALRSRTEVNAIAGDVTDPHHRAELARAAADHGHLDLLINNASELGGSPQPALRDLAAETLERILAVNVIAPLQLTRAVLGLLVPDAAVINISSDAAVDHYPGWGGYGASKAALDHLTMTLAVENPQLRLYAVDPGDLRTEMHQAAFPGEDISDRPEPETVVPHFLRLIGSSLPSGRYRAAELPAHLLQHSPQHEPTDLLGATS